MNARAISTAAPNAVRAKIEATRSRVSTDASRAKWLAEGERFVGQGGGMGNSAIYSPASSRSDVTVDQILYFGPTGVLCHQEPAEGDAAAWFRRVHAA